MGVVAAVFVDQLVDVVGRDRHEQVETTFAELRILAVHELQRARVVALRVLEQAIPLSLPVLPYRMGTDSIGALPPHPLPFFAATAGGPRSGRWPAARWSPPPRSPTC
jgi:hypothetical protein